MFKYRCGRKRELSIYSILTIIVLISILGGCAEVPGRLFSATTRNDAGLLVTGRDFDMLNAGAYIRHDGAFEQEIRERGLWLLRDDRIEITKIDGQYLPIDQHADWGKIELAPGRHDITIIIRLSPRNRSIDKWYDSSIISDPTTTLTRSIEVDKGRVYFLHAGFDWAGGRTVVR